MNQADFAFGIWVLLLVAFIFIDTGLDFNIDAAIGSIILAFVALLILLRYDPTVRR